MITRPFGCTDYTIQSNTLYRMSYRGKKKKLEVKKKKGVLDTKWFTVADPSTRRPVPTLY